MNDFSETKALREEGAREQLRKRVYEPHVKPLNDYIDRLRSRLGEGFTIPYVDPNDGGVESRILVLLEAPGPQAAFTTGFVSRNNPDESAANFLSIFDGAGLHRGDTVVWNIVPWYLGDGARITPAAANDVEAARDLLFDFMSLCTRLRAVVLMGKAAQRAEATIAASRPELEIIKTPHPSPQFVNRHPNNKAKILAPLKALADSGQSWPD